MAYIAQVVRDGCGSRVPRLTQPPAVGVEAMADVIDEDRTTVRWLGSATGDGRAQENQPNPPQGLTNGDSALLIILPSRAEPSRAEPSRAEPSRAEPSRAEPSRAEPSRAEPSRAEPSRAEPMLRHDRRTFIPDNPPRLSHSPAVQAGSFPRTFRPPCHLARRRWLTPRVHRIEDVSARTPSPYTHHPAPHEFAGRMAAAHRRRDRFGRSAASLSTAR